MKQSEILKREMIDAENDHAFWNLEKKYKRQLRLELFESDILPILKDNFEIEYIPNSDGYRFYSKDHQTKFTYYPKADKINHHKKNKWYRNGLYFLEKQILNNLQ